MHIRVEVAGQDSFATTFAEFAEANAEAIREEYGVPSILAARLHAQGHFDLGGGASPRVVVRLAERQGA